MKYLIVCLSILLTSCTTFIEHNTRVSIPNHEPMIISIHKSESKNPNTLGYVEITGNVCKVFLTNYPNYLAHEIRHCFEVNWHEGREDDSYR